MHHTQTVAITAADDEIVAGMAGTERNSPHIVFHADGEPWIARAEIRVNPTLLTRAEQAAWLDRLAAAASELAKAVRALT